MECVWNGSIQNARANLVLEVVLQIWPCFDKNLWFCVLGCLGAWKIMFLAWYIVMNLFQMVSSLGFNRCTSYGTFARFLVFEAKGELTKAKVVQASLRPAESWWAFPDVCGCCLYKEIRSMAQDKPNCKKCALWKWYCNLYAIFGINQCVMLHNSEQCLCPMYFHLIKECGKV